jgi:hypothetical protein
VTKVAGVLLLTTLSAGALAVSPDVRLYVNIDEHYGTVYVPPAAHGADFVCFRGQPLSLRVSVVNHGLRKQLRLRQGATLPFDTRVQRAGSGRGDTVPQIGFDAVERVSARKRASVTLPATLDTSDRLEWIARVNGLDAAPPGVYRVAFEPRLQTAAGESLAINNDSVVIELRDVAGAADRIEVLRIDATRASASGDPAGADRCARQLLAAHPASVYGHLILADVALQRRDVAAGRAALGQALKLLAARADTLLTAMSSEHTLQELALALQAKYENAGR